MPDNPMLDHSLLTLGEFVARAPALVTAFETASLEGGGPGFSMDREFNIYEWCRVLAMFVQDTGDFDADDPTRRLP